MRNNMAVVYAGLVSTVVLMGIAAPSIVFACSDNEYQQCTGDFPPTRICGCLPKISVPEPVRDLADAPRLIFTNLEKALGDIGRTLEKAANDAGSNIARSASDAAAEAQRVRDGLRATADALVDAADAAVAASNDAIRSAERRVREGKAVDALWHLSLAPVQIQEKSASTAVLESSYLRAVGQAAASSYGPAGAAAYAAWLTYRETGDPTLALRVGVLTGASSAAFGAAKEIDGTVKRAIVTGAIGGTAVAAAGGSREAIEKAFLQAGAMIVIQDGYQELTNHQLDGGVARGKAYCVTATASDCTPLPPGAIVGKDEVGNFIVDMRNVDPKIPAVGLKDYRALFNESNPVMVAASRVPGIQAMAVFHDQWALDWNMGALATPTTIIPAIVMTYTGLGVPFYDHLRETAVDAALRPNATPIGPSVATPQDVVAPSQSVNAAYWQLERGESKRVLLHVRRPDSMPLWCSGHGEIYVERKVGHIDMTVGNCISLGNPGRHLDGTTIQPQDGVDDACRAVLIEGKAVTTIISSLRDRSACESAVAAYLAKHREDGSVWYSAVRH